MPVILTQHFSPADRVYQDAEFSLYHYPRQYFSRVRPYDRFIYYRPLGNSRRRFDSLHYFGHGVLGEVFDDPFDPRHRFVRLIQGERFVRPVPLNDPAGRWYETESAQKPQFQSSVRQLSETAYYRILAAGDVSSALVSALPNAETIVEYEVPIAARAPHDPLRPITDIPRGAGYVPNADVQLNVYESAALQERARADHQHVLAVIQREVQKRGGATWYSNNIDLFARVGEERFLIEAKSLTDIRDAVDRMRYGIGQLADYGYRYRSELGDARSVLAFGRRPTRDIGWIGNVLDEQRIGFVAVEDERVIGLNEHARGIAMIS